MLKKNKNKIEKIALWSSEMRLLELIVALQNVCDTIRQAPCFRGVARGISRLCSHGSSAYDRSKSEHLNKIGQEKCSALKCSWCCINQTELQQEHKLVKSNVPPYRIWWRVKMDKYVADFRDVGNELNYSKFVILVFMKL